MSFLQQRGGVWWFRRMVPKQLRSIMGKREVRVSLKTGEYEVAKRSAIAVAARVDRQFAEAEAARTNPTVAASRALRVDAEERADREQRGVPRTDADEDALDDFYITRLEADERDERRLSPTDRAVALAMLKRNNKNGPPLSVLLEKWAVEREPPSKTWQEWQTVWRRFQEVVGDLPVRELKRSHVRDFKDALLKMPRRVPTRLLQQKATVQQIIATCPDSPRVSGATVQKALNAVRSVLAWGVRNDYLESNPAADLRLAMRTPRERPRLPYEVDDLRVLFSSPLYTGCASRQQRAIAGPNVYRDDACWWLPMLALFTGARREELGQLCVEDVGEEDGVPYIYIRQGDGRKVKTGAKGERRVPLHPEVLRLGFLQHVDAMRAAGHARVFPELQPSKRHAQLTDAYGKWYGRYCRSIGIKDAKKVMHSYRHLMADRLRAAGVSEEHKDAILGHVGGGVGRSYGRGVPLAQLAESLGKVTFPGLDLRRLYLSK